MSTDIIVINSVERLTADLQTDAINVQPQIYRLKNIPQAVSEVRYDL